MRIGVPQINAPVTTDPHIQLLGDPTNASPVDGDFWFDGTSLNFRDASSTTDLLAGGGAFKVDNFVRLTSTASGTQAITGVGFQPKLVIFFASGGADPASSVGADDAIESHSLANNHNETAENFQFVNNAIRMRYTSGDRYDGEIQSMDSDGFTIIWTKTNSPTLNISAGFAAFG